MNTKIAVILTVLVMLSLGMAVMIVNDYVTIGKPAGQEALADQATEGALPEGEGAETTLVAGATTAAGATTTAAGATTAAPVTTAGGAATTVAGATTTTRVTTAAQTTTAKTTTTQGMGAIVTTTGGMGGIVTTTTQGMGVLVTTTQTLAKVGELPSGKADLAVYGNLLPGPEQSLSAGYQIVLDGFTIKNIGTVPSGDFWIAYYLSESMDLTSSQSKKWYINGNKYGGLSPGQELKIQPTVERLPSAEALSEKGREKGIHVAYVGVLVDARFEVDEISKTNNYLVSRIVLHNF